MKLVHLSRFTFAIVSLLSLPVKAAPYYVNNCGNDANCNGQYPACYSAGVSNCAKKTIQAGINSTTANGDEVIVADGEYKGLGNRALIFTKWPNGEARHITVRSAYGPDNCIINCESAARAFNFDHSVVGQLESQAVVDGLTIKNGSSSIGGAIYISDTSPTIQRCVFSNNNASSDGGAIYAVKNANPTFDRCTFQGNSAGHHGGAIYLAHQGVGSTHIDGTIVDSLLKSNSAEWRGGAIYVVGNAPNVVIKNSRIEGNTSVKEGGGIAAEGFEPDTVKIVNCVISKNEATGTDGYGGGLAFLGSQSTGADLRPQVMNTIVSANTAKSGGGVYVSYGYVRMKFVNSVIYGNTATDAAGGHAVFNNGRNVSPRSTLSNTIIWSNPLPSSSLVRVCEDCQLCECQTLRIEKSDVRGTIPSTVEQYENISADPVFVDPDGADNILGTVDDDLRIHSTSPCINAGEESYRLEDFGDLDGDENISELTPLDLDLFNRWVGTQVDMGPYEYDGCTENADCDDEDPCTGVEFCSNGHCERDINDCNLNGKEDICDDPLVGITNWQSVHTHGSVGEIGLDIPDGGSFSEPRRFDTGTNPQRTISKLVISLSGPIDSAVGTSNVALVGNDQYGQPMILSSISIATQWDAASDKLIVTFTPALPDFARYRVTLSDIRDLSCIPLQENLERIMTGLVGDAIVGLRVNATDLGGVRPLEGTNPIDPAVEFQVRSDINHSGNIDESDTDIVRDNVGHDARFIPDP